MKQKELELVLSSKKVIRDLPQDWESVKEGTNYKQVDVEFGTYCEKLYNSLLGIKKYYEKDFNADNTYTIDECIELFESSYNKILTILRPKTDEQAREILFSRPERFEIFKNKKKINKDVYKRDSLGIICGFSNWGYEKILPNAKKIFMLEKFCAFTTRKFWKREITKIQNLDMKKPFKILVKCIFPYNWRMDGVTQDLREYYNQRIYSSTSLVDEKTTSQVFTMPTSKVVAALIVDYDNKIFVCASNEDSFSEEKINDNNKLLYKVDYSNVMLVDESNTHKTNHKCYANAVETETPKNILNNIFSYSEVNVKNAKPVGVLVPNIESYNFAKQEAERRNLPLYVPENIKNFMEKHPEDFEEILNR